MPIMTVGADVTMYRFFQSKVQARRDSQGEAGGSALQLIHR
jgi:hypothetical protein